MKRIDKSVLFLPTILVVCISILLSVYEKNFEVVAFTNNLVLASIFGSTLLALGSAIMLTQNATTGGTSITAKILNKYLI